MTTKHTIIKEKLEEYLELKRDGNRKALSILLSALVEVTKMHRKSIIRGMRTHQMSSERKEVNNRGRKRIYTNECISALFELWEIAHKSCGERVHPCIVEYIRILIRDKMWSYSDETTELLKKMSLGLVKYHCTRFAHKDSTLQRGRSTTKPSELKEIIPIRRGPWDNPLPGYGEIDSVVHCGATLWGDYCYTVQYTDVDTTWTGLSGQ